MNTTRILTTIAAAAAMAGGIGFAYAQSTSDSTQAPASTYSTPMTTPAPSTPPSPSVDAGNTVGPPDAMPPATRTDDVAAPAERAPKADRG
jgi:hypothetical protein